MSPALKSSSDRELPPVAPRLGPDFARRLELWLQRTAASRHRPIGAEGTARSAAAGAGFEFLGHRAYRAGESVSELDWDVLARTNEAFVRVRARESGERWLVLLDASASMSIGAPAKIQTAAELAAAMALFGARSGARVDIATASSRFVARKQADLAACLAFLEGQLAHGSGGLRELLPAAVNVRAERVFAIGDLCDVEPRELLAIARPGRALCAVQILAVDELAPSQGREAVEWFDPETGAITAVELSTEVLDRYAQLLTGRLEAWRASCAAHRARYLCSTSARPFEELASETLGR